LDDATKTAFRPEVLQRADALSAVLHVWSDFLSSVPEDGKEQAQSILDAKEQIADLQRQIAGGMMALCAAYEY
jgi:hypothetical protein